MQDNNIQNPSPGGFLIVDDISINIFITEEMLVLYGAPIDTAMSGAEAVEKIKEGNVYDIIFMDHMMPEMNGIEATQAIRAMGYTGCIIALSAHGPGENNKLYLNSGFNRYISKPIDPDVLDDIVRDFVDLDKYDDDANAGEEESDTEENENQTAKEAAANDYFLIDAKAALDFLERMFAVPHAVTSEEAERYEVTMHGIKSALAGIGEKTLSEAAYELERAVKYDDYNIVFEDTPEFISDLKALIEKIEGFNVS